MSETKTVKLCANCKLYNNPAFTNCDECNFPLGDELYEVNLSLKRAPSQETELKVDVSPAPIEEMTKTKICPHCKMSNNYDAVDCKFCHRLIIDVSPTKEARATEDSLLMILVSTNLKVELKLTSTPFIFGRDSLPDGDLRFETISRKQFTCEIKDNQLYITDHSLNGTSLDGQRLIPQMKNLVEDGAVIKIAEHTFIVHISAWIEKK